MKRYTTFCWISVKHNHHAGKIWKIIHQDQKYAARPYEPTIFSWSIMAVIIVDPLWYVKLPPTFRPTHILISPLSQGPMDMWYIVGRILHVHVQCTVQSGHEKRFGKEAGQGRSYEVFEIEHPCLFRLANILISLMPENIWYERSWKYVEVERRWKWEGVGSVRKNNLGKPKYITPLPREAPRLVLPTINIVLWY